MSHESESVWTLVCRDCLKGYFGDEHKTIGNQPYPPNLECTVCGASGPVYPVKTLEAIDARWRRGGGKPAWLRVHGGEHPDWAIGQFQFATGGGKLLCIGVMVWAEAFDARIGINQVVQAAPEAIREILRHEWDGGDVGGCAICPSCAASAYPEEERRHRVDCAWDRLLASVGLVTQAERVAALQRIGKELPHG
jgi:hypothetical protein